jgi:hypothetical protein
MAMVALVLMTAASCKSERQRSSTPKKPAVKKAADPWATIDQTKRPVIIDSHVHLTPLPETINLAL